MHDSTLASEAPGGEIVPTLLPPSSEPRRAALVVVRRPQQEPLVCWDLPEFEAPHGEPFELECHAFSGTERGAVRQALVLAVQGQRGSAALAALSSASLIRVALGYRADGVFVPLVIASEVNYVAGALDVRFRPPFSDQSVPTPVERSLVEQFAT